MSFKERILKLKSNAWVAVLIFLKDILSLVGSMLDAIQPTAPMLVGLTEKLTAMEFDWYDTINKVVIVVIIIWWRSSTKEAIELLRGDVSAQKAEIDELKRRLEIQGTQLILRRAQDGLRMTGGYPVNNQQTAREWDSLRTWILENGLAQNGKAADELLFTFYNFRREQLGIPFI